MAYARRRWQDHSVERPRTYTEAVNEDGSKTYTPAFGEVLQEGTPQSATNFNAIEEGLQHTNIAFEVMYCATQATIRDLQERLALAEAKLATLP